MRAGDLYAYRQGELDGLCGIYSVLNAVRFALLTADLSGSPSSRVRHLRPDECALLFTTLVSTVGRRHRQAQFVFAGLGPSHLRSLLRSTDEWLRVNRGLSLVRSRPLDRDVRKATLISNIRRHLNVPGSAAIIGAKEPWLHWTVATRITKARLHLLDSEGDTSIAISPGPRRLRYHAGLIDPSCLYLLQLKELKAAANKPPKQL